MEHVRLSPLERANAVAGAIAAEALSSERLGRLTDTAATALLEANLLSILIPEHDGGLGASRVEFFQAAEVIAQADGSAGWCLSVCNATNYAAFRGLSEEGRREIFGAAPTSCWVCLFPNAVSTPEAGGYRVSGDWTFGSGSSFSSWVLVASPIEAAAGGGPRFRAHLVPKADVEIEPGSWDVMGLRATASIDYALAGVFVPARRTYEYAFSPEPDACALSSLEVIALNQIGLTAFASGVAQHAMAELIVSAAKTKRLAGQGTLAEDNVVQFGIGELDGRLRAARAHFLERVGWLDARAAEGAVVGLDESVHQAALTLARAARDTVLFAFDQAATSVVYARQPLQRCLRDLLTGLKHATFTPAVLARIGKSKLGLEAAPVFFVRPAGS